MLSSNVLADDINTASQPDATTSETETTPTSSDAVDEQVIMKELFELETFALVF